MLLPKKQNKKNYKSLSGIYLKSRHESPANSSDKSESVNCAKALQYARLPGSSLCGSVDYSGSYRIMQLIFSTQGRTLYVSGVA